MPAGGKDSPKRPTWPGGRRPGGTPVEGGPWVQARGSFSRCRPGGFERVGRGPRETTCRPPCRRALHATVALARRLRDETRRRVGGGRQLLAMLYAAFAASRLWIDAPASRKAGTDARECTPPQVSLCMWISYEKVKNRGLSGSGEAERREEIAVLVNATQDIVCLEAQNVRVVLGGAPLHFSGAHGRRNGRRGHRSDRVDGDGRLG